MPNDAANFSFWMAEVMPVDDHVKAALLQSVAIALRTAASSGKLTIPHSPHAGSHLLANGCG